jgi:hypothetical protein
MNLLIRLLRNINRNKRRNTSKRRWLSKMFTQMITMSLSFQAGLRTKKPSPKYQFISNKKSIQMLSLEESMQGISNWIWVSYLKWETKILRCWMKEGAQQDNGKMRKNLPLPMSFWMHRNKTLLSTLTMYRMSMISILFMSSRKKTNLKRMELRIKIESDFYLQNI